MPKLRAHNISISVDGYMAGPDQDLDNPLGVGGPRLHEWVFKTHTGVRMLGEQGGDEGIDDRFMAQGDADIGATVMGRNMFGPIRGEWGDDSWKGWWGDNPPYHHPVFVLTHHPHEPIPMEGGTTFNFVTDRTRASVRGRRRPGREVGWRRGHDPAVPAGAADRRDSPGDRPDLPWLRRAPL